MPTNKTRFNAVSSLLLLSAFLLGSSICITIFPYSTFKSITNHEQDIFNWLVLILGSGALFISVATTIFLQKLEHKNNRQYLKFTKKFDPFSISEFSNLKPKIENLHPNKDISYLLSGDIDLVHDDGNRLEVSPIHFKATHEGKIENFILFPAAFIKRFTKHPNSMGSVLSHEVAHVINNDINLLFNSARFLRVLIIIGIITTLASLIKSIHTDILKFEIVSFTQFITIFWASLVGRSYLFFTILISLIAFFLTKKMVNVREELADSFAIKLFGLDNLKQARAVMSGSTISHHHSLDSNNSFDHITNTIGTKTLWFVFGVSITISAGFIISPFSYLSRNADLTTFNILSTSASFLDTLLLLIAFSSIFLFLSKLPDEKRLEISQKYEIKFQTFFIIGTVLGFWMSQSLPLTLTSIAMPQGFDAPARNDAIPLTLGSVYDSALKSIGSSLIVMAFLKVHRGKLPWLLLIFCFVMIALSFPIEQYFLYSYTYGVMAPTLIFILFFLMLLFSKNTANKFKCILMSAFGILLLSFGGTMSHVADCLRKNGIQQYLNGANSLAESSLTLSTKLSPFVSTARIELIRLQYNVYGHKHPPLLVNAILSANAVLDSSWHKKLDTSLILADIYLERGSQHDLEQAKLYYQAIKKRWRQYSRMDQSKIAHALYKFAVTKEALKERPTDTLLLLSEALLLDSSLAKKMINDKDLASINILKEPKPFTSNFIESIKANQLTEPSEIEKHIIKGTFSDKDIENYLRLLITNMINSTLKT